MEFVGAYSDRAFELRDGHLDAVRDWRSPRVDGLGGSPLRIARAHDDGWLAYPVTDNIPALPWDHDAVILAADGELAPSVFDQLWVEHVVPRLSTYGFSMSRPGFGEHLFGTEHGPEFDGSGNGYAEYVEDEYAIGGFDLFANGVRPRSLCPVPPGCAPVEEDSAVFFVLDESCDIAPVPRDEYDGLWRERVLATTRYFRGWVEESFGWRRCDGTVERGPAWSYQKVFGRWIVEEHYITCGSGPSRRLDESPTHMNGFIAYDEIAEHEFVDAVVSGDGA